MSNDDNTREGAQWDGDPKSGFDPEPAIESDPIALLPGDSASTAGAADAVGRGEGVGTAKEVEGLSQGQIVWSRFLRHKGAMFGVAVLALIALLSYTAMGIGPIPASHRALARAGIGVDALSMVELNEAFASQTIASFRTLRIPEDKVNQAGGAIALGHPLGCSGARIVTTLVHGLRRSGGEWGLASMCIGVGQGIACVLQRTV